MTDETKKLFNAPWFPFSIACDFHGLKRSNGSEIFSDASLRSEVNRLARLPELYDALVETVYYKCFECMGGLRHNIDMTREELVKNGCPKQNKSNVCIYVKHIELLRKVRDGE